MSSAQVIDSEKMASQLHRFFADARKEKHRNAEMEAIAKREEAAMGDDAGYDTTSMAQQMGRPLSRAEIVARLSLMNRNLHFYQSIAYPETGCIYFRDGISNMEDPNPLYRGLRRIVGMEWTGISPEFTCRKVKTDEHGVRSMVGQVRGWRTVLQRLIKERLITVEQAEQGFSVSRGRSSEKWWQSLQ